METRGKAAPVIVVDAGKVLVDYNFRPLLAELARRAGREIRPFDFPDFHATMRSIYSGKQSVDELRRRLNAHFDLQLEPAEWRDLWCGVLTGEVPGMYDLLLWLRRTFRIVALTNTEMVHWTHVLETYPIFGLLDDWVASFEVGVAKPDLEIFSMVMDRHCGGEPPVFYTDDNEEFVEAARTLGWTARVFRGADDLHGDIRMRTGGDREDANQ